MGNSIGDWAAAATQDLDGDPTASSAGQRRPRESVTGFLDIRAVADLFGRAPRTVRWWISTGRLPAVRIGRTPFVPETELRNLLRSVAGHEPSSAQIDTEEKAVIEAEGDGTGGVEE